MFNNVFLKILAFVTNVEKYDRAGQRKEDKYGACAVHAR
jgi:hypothetical protein